MLFLAVVCDVFFLVMLSFRCNEWGCFLLLWVVLFLVMPFLSVVGDAFSSNAVSCCCGWYFFDWCCLFRVILSVSSDSVSSCCGWCFFDWCCVCFVWCCFYLLWVMHFRVMLFGRCFLLLFSLVMLFRLMFSRVMPFLAVVGDAFSSFPSFSSDAVSSCCGWCFFYWCCLFRVMLLLAVVVMLFFFEWCCFLLWWSFSSDAVSCCCGDNFFEWCCFERCCF